MRLHPRTTGIYTIGIAHYTYCAPLHKSRVSCGAIDPRNKFSPVFCKANFTRGCIKCNLFAFERSLLLTEWGVFVGNRALFALTSAGIAVFGHAIVIWILPVPVVISHLPPPAV